MRSPGTLDAQIALFVLCTGLSGLTAAATGTDTDERNQVAYEARVTRVFDGDTLWVKPLKGGRYRKLRLDGLDAPEICQTGGLVARDALAARVLRQVVTVNERQLDHYGRALVHLSHQGEDVGAWLVGRGHAWAYRWRYSEGAYAGQERQARAQHKVSGRRSHLDGWQFASAKAS